MSAKDGNAVAGAVKVDESTKAMKNLGTLRRIDAEISEVLQTAGHVTVYVLNQNVMKWERKNIEGPLFIVKRRSDPRFQVLVLNRVSTENLVEDILGDSFAFELSNPYIMYRNLEGIIIGIWFYSERECETISSLLSKILSTYQPEPVLSLEHESSENNQHSLLTQPQPPARQPSTQLPQEHGSTDILTKLFRGVSVNSGSDPLANLDMTTPKLLTPAELAQKSSINVPSLNSQAPMQSQANFKEKKEEEPLHISRDQVRALVSRLAANDDFIDIVAKEIKKILR